MPELPEVETVVRGIRPDVVGRRILWMRSSWPAQLRGTPAEAFEDRLRGQRITGVHRRAKYIVFELDCDVLLIHLKMTGRLYVVAEGAPQPEDKHVRASFGLEGGTELRFSDARKFGRVILVGREAEITGRIGPEPLDASFTLEAFKERLARRSAKLKPLLLDQAFLAGVGNIYADEALWQARLHPLRTAASLSEAEAQALYDALRAVLEQGITNQGASINWYRQANGSKGSQQDHFEAYGREAQPCSRCGTPIIKIRVGQRGTHLCPQCQPLETTTPELKQHG